MWVPWPRGNNPSFARQSMLVSDAEGIPVITASTTSESGGVIRLRLLRGVVAGVECRTGCRGLGGCETCEAGANGREWV